MKTTDGGTNWASQTSGTSNSLYSVHFTDQNIGWAVGAIGTILKTTNGGTTWTSQISGTSYDLYSVHFTDQNTGWAVGEYGTILKTTNGGINWISQTSGTSYELSSVHFTDQNIGWVVGSRGTILKTTNGGIPVELTSFIALAKGNTVVLNWSTATEINNQGFEIERKSFESEFEKIGYVAGFGTTTEPKSYSFTNNNVSSGIYTYRLKQIDFDGSFEYSEDIEVEVSVLIEFSLSQNYPNPFNPTTNIKYQIPQISFVTLKVYDVLGNEIAILINEEKPTGNYEVEFDGNDFTSGVYFYQLRVGDFIETKKMVFMK